MAREVIFDKKNVLVAGGAGFIGSHLCDELIKTCKVICVDDFISGSERNIDHLLANPDFIFINHNLSQPLVLAEHPELAKFKVEFQGIQEIYNLACPMSPKAFLDNRIEILKANSLVVINLLELARQYQAKFMQFSSSVVYGSRGSSQAANFKFAETEMGVVNHLSARGAYDEGKRFAETIVNNYREVYQLDTKIVRLFRIYGPRMELNDDQMIPDFINDALDNREIVIPGRAEFSSSFCYIDDALDGITKMMASRLAGPINLGSDVDIKLAEVVDFIIKETHSQSTVKHIDSPLFVSELVLPNIVQAKNDLGWMPVVTLENGLRKTIVDLKVNKRRHGLGG
ncbi:MAG: NAD-dependent epimerase/dehydratase family protein [Patescibacteria group bacterium]|jgi:UDP-glucuronate decarboxylase